MGKQSQIELKIRVYKDEYKQIRVYKDEYKQTLKLRIFLPVFVQCLNRVETLQTKLAIYNVVEG